MHATPVRHPVALLLAVILAAALLAAPAAADDHAGGDGDQAPVPEWAEAEEATVTPGVQMVTGGGQCTANFVFHDARVETDDPEDLVDIYLGYAAHCAGTTGSTTTNGCDAGSQDLGTPVQIQGADHPGTLVYSSWLTVNELDEADANVCAFNDFALVRIDPRDHDKVNPSIPFWGGPEGVNTDGAPTGSEVYTYGNSGLRLGIELLSPKNGFSLGTQGGGWSHRMYTVTPGVPGDSGSALLDADGAALGSLSTVAIAPFAGSNGAADIGRALAYANDNSDLDVVLAEGTEPFTARLTPVPGSP